MNQSIICWKWDDRALNDNLSEKVEDLTSRFGADTITVAVHWVKKAFGDEALKNRVRQCADLLHKKGKRLCIEACIRNEGEGFWEKHPMEKAYLSHMVSVVLDDNGNAEIPLDIEPVYHYWRVTAQNGPEAVLGAWAFCKVGDTQYCPETLCDIKQCARIAITAADEARQGCRQMNFGGSVEESPTAVKSVLIIEAGIENAGKTAAIMVGILQAIPDLASDKLICYYRTMLQDAKDEGVDGVFSDEWGYDVILKIAKANPYDDNNLFLRHLSVSNAMASRYAKAFPGNALCEDLLHFYYAPQDKPEIRMAAINRYISTLRSITAQNDREMLAAAKEILGSNVFYGIHPTWWGSVDSLFFEVFKNGFYWWEAQRDVAQTDETVIIPIRTALAHKWGSSIWYNMWYSMGTLDLSTYFGETWRNLRFGGRTHYHGYECPNEAVVLALSQEGMLEQLEEMDALVRTAEPLQTTQPNARTLVLFGMEAITNWALAGKPLPPWTPQSEPMELVLNTAAKLFEHLLFDLVPSTELANGSVVLRGGKAAYGTQEYDTVVLLLPESMDEACYHFLRAISPGNLLVYGRAEFYNNGKKVTEQDISILQNARRYSETIPPADELARQILDTGVAANRYSNGCIFQDGSAIFTSDEGKNRKNALHVDCDYQGRHIVFDGMDYLYINAQGGEIKAFSPQEGTLFIDDSLTACK